MNFISAHRFAAKAMLLVSGILCSLSTAVRASEYLGFLGELANPESRFSAQFELTEQQQLDLMQLTSRRSSAAIGLAAQLKETPRTEHPQMLSAFAAESEQMAYQLLQPEQQERFSQLRLQWMGLTSLADEEVAIVLNLADWQKEIVSDWREQLRVARRANNEAQVKPQAERAIRGEISDSQWTAWQVMAGLLPDSAAGSPVPPVRGGIATFSSDLAEQVTVTGEVTQRPEDSGLLPVDEVELQLNFQRQPWADVIRWLADQADLSVHSETTPPGTFTYRDRSRNYSIAEALDVMNAYLLDSGYALFRQGRMLRCINFEEDQKMRGELLKELTDTISLAELESRGRYEPVRVLFNLKRLDPMDIIEEVEDLLSVQGTAIGLVTSGQLLVTDMAGNVRNVAEFIRRAEDPNSARGAAVQTISLKSINAEEVLSVARPLLELEADSNVSERIKISTNTFGTVIYVRGDIDKVQILRDLAEQMDMPPNESERPATYEAPYIGRHLVRGIDLQLAYEVAAQLLAGAPDVKLATDETAKQLVLMGRKSDHQLIKETLDVLAGEASDFKVIPLQNLDASMAIAAVKKFFGLPDKSDAASGDPVIDGDAVARQIWVKGTASQVRQIEELITKLEANAKSTRSMWGDRLRILPSGGSGAAEALRQAESLWQEIYGGQNPIVNSSTQSESGGLKSRTFAPPKATRESTKEKGNSGQKSTMRPNPVPPAAEEGSRSTQHPSPADQHRVIGQTVDQEVVPAGLLVKAIQEGTEDRPASQIPEASDSFSDDWDSKKTDQATQGSPIVIREGPGGLMITSDDPEALERFENLLRLIMEQTSLSDIEPQVVYLQHIKAAAAKQLLTDILSGSASAGGGAGGLLGDMASSMLGGLGGGMLGSLLGGGGGTTSGPGSSGMAIGEYSIVADPRLNALFIKASPPDMRLIEQLLRVIDQVEGPFSVETQGVMELIPVLTQNVTDVLATVKSVFGDRVEGNASASGGGQAARQQSNPGDFLQAMRSAFGGGRGGGGPQQPARTELNEPKISLGADTFTNTLIVVAQPYQIEEVRRLVDMLDEAGEGEQEEVVVVEMGAIASTALTDSLKRVLGPKAQTATSGSGGSSSSGQTRSSSPTSSAASGGGQFDADAARRRAEFFQRMIQGGGMMQGGAAGGRGTTGNTGRSGNNNRTGRGR